MRNTLPWLLVLGCVGQGCALGALDDRPDTGSQRLDGPSNNDTPDRGKPQKDKGVSPDKKKPPRLDSGTPPTPDKSLPKPDKHMPIPDKSTPKPDKFVPKPDMKPTGPLTVVSMDFEQTSGGLKHWGDWEWGKIAFKPGANCDAHSSMSPPTAGHSGNGAWGTKINDCYSPANNAASSCNNQNPNDDSILRLETTLPKGYKKATLSFWEWRDYNLDWDWVELRVAGQVLHQDCTGSTISPMKWTQRSVDISGSIGQFVGIEWHFMATSVVQLSGWYIDDVKIVVQN